jgi:MFS family permease
MTPLCTGIMGAMYSIAAVIGPLLGGVFSDKATWRWCMFNPPIHYALRCPHRCLYSYPYLGFYINLPLGGLAAVFIVIFFKTPKHVKPTEATWKEKILQMDPVGIGLVMCSILCYTLAMQYGGQTHPWKSSLVIGLIIGFVLIAITFCFWEFFQGERAAVVPRIFVDRNVWVNGFFGTMIAASYFIVIYYIPIYFQSIDNISPIESGVRNFALIIPVAIGLIMTGSVITKTGVAIPFMVVGSALATVGSGLLYSLDFGSSTGKWIGYQIIGGFAWGSCFQVPMIAGQGRADMKDLSSITAIILCKLSPYFQINKVKELTKISQSSNYLVVHLAYLQRSLPSPTALLSSQPEAPPPSVLLFFLLLVPQSLEVSSTLTNFLGFCSPTCPGSKPLLR